MKSMNGFNLQKLLTFSLLLFTLFLPTSSHADDYTLNQGLNLLSYPFEVTPGYSAFDFLTGLGESYVGRIERYNQQRGAFEAASWFNGNPAGVDFPMVAGEGYFVRMVQSGIISGTPACASVSVTKGFNLTGFPCPFSGYTSYDLLEDLGDENEVISIEKYDINQDKYLKTYYNAGTPAGDNFTITHGEAFIVSMQVDKVFAAPPTGLAAGGRDRLIVLSWNPPQTGDVTGYLVYRSENPSGPFITAIAPSLITDATYTDASIALVNDKTYYYVVSAVYPGYE